MPARCVFDSPVGGLSWTDRAQFPQYSRRSSSFRSPSRGHFPSTLGAAVRQKARWLRGIALAGWDRLGWRGGLGERWMRMRDRRGPLAALLLVAGYVAALLWSQLWLAKLLGAPIKARMGPALTLLLTVNAWLLGWRILMRASFTASASGWREGLLSIPRLFVGNVVAMLAAARAVSIHFGGGATRWDKTRHIFPVELPQRGRRFVSSRLR